MSTRTAAPDHHDPVPPAWHTVTQVLRTMACDLVYAPTGVRVSALPPIPHHDTAAFRLDCAYEPAGATLYFAVRSTAVVPAARFAAMREYVARAGAELAYHRMAFDTPEGVLSLQYRVPVVGETISGDLVKRILTWLLEDAVAFFPEAELVGLGRLSAAEAMRLAVQAIERGETRPSAAHTHT